MKEFQCFLHFQMMNSKYLWLIVASTPEWDAREHFVTARKWKFSNCAQYLHVWPHAWQVLQPDHSISSCYIHGHETHCTWHLWSTAVHQWIHVQDRHSKLPAKVNVKAISSILPHFFNSVISDTCLIRQYTSRIQNMVPPYIQSMTLCMSVFLPHCHPRESQG